MVAFSFVRPKGRLASVSRGFLSRVLRLANSVPLRTIIGVAWSWSKGFIRNNPKYRGRVEASQLRRDRSPRMATGSPAHLCRHVDSARSVASLGHRAQGCCGGDVDAG